MFESQKALDLLEKMKSTVEEVRSLISQLEATKQIKRPPMLLKAVEMDTVLMLGSIKKMRAALELNLDNLPNSIPQPPSWPFPTRRP